MKVAQKLKENPGQWQLAGVSTTRQGSVSMARAIKTGRTSTWHPAGDFEAVSRTEDGEFRVYARYLGEGGLPNE